MTTKQTKTLEFTRQELMMICTIVGVAKSRPYNFYSLYKRLCEHLDFRVGSINAEKMFPKGIVLKNVELPKYFSSEPKFNKGDVVVNDGGIEVLVTSDFSKTYFSGVALNTQSGAKKGDYEEDWIKEYFRDEFEAEDFSHHPLISTKELKLIQTITGGISGWGPARDITSEIYYKLYDLFFHSTENEFHVLFDKWIKINEGPLPDFFQPRPKFAIGEEVKNKHRDNQVILVTGKGEEGTQFSGVVIKEGLSPFFRKGTYSTTWEKKCFAPNN